MPLICVCVYIDKERERERFSFYPPSIKPTPNTL